MRRTLAAEEQQKRTKYESKCADAGWRFQPLAFHPYAGYTPEGAQFLHRLARMYAEGTTVRPTKAARLTFVWASLGVTVKKEVTAQLRLTTYTGPQGPVLPHVWPMDA